MRIGLALVVALASACGGGDDEPEFVGMYSVNGHPTIASAEIEPLDDPYDFVLSVESTFLFCVQNGDCIDCPPDAAGLTAHLCATEPGFSGEYTDTTGTYDVTLIRL